MAAAAAVNKAFARQGGKTFEHLRKIVEVNGP